MKGVHVRKTIGGTKVNSEGVDMDVVKKKFLMMGEQWGQQV
jgi:hypothetical protein